jgi:hypothetical protein
MTEPNLHVIDFILQISHLPGKTTTRTDMLLHLLLSFNHRGSLQ